MENPWKIHGKLVFLIRTFWIKHKRKKRRKRIYDVPQNITNLKELNKK